MNMLGVTVANLSGLSVDVPGCQSISRQKSSCNMGSLVEAYVFVSLVSS